MDLDCLPRWSNCAGTAVNSLLPGKVTTAFALLVRITNSSKQSIIRVIGIKLTGGDSPGQDNQPTASAYTLKETLNNGLVCPTQFVIAQ